MQTTQTIEQRIKLAEQLWEQGKTAEFNNNYQLAYELHTQAHDTIMDCAKLHQKAHENLRRVNRELGNYGELITDWLLHCFAPLGVFEMVSYFSKTDAFGSVLCKRNA